MNIGNKILELRKENHLTQEELAEKLNVTRQTISKWELCETSPDLKDSKKLAEIFNVTLDELTNNDVKNILIAKVSKTEKLTKIIFNILKIFLLLIIILIVLGVAIIKLREYFEVKPVATGQSIICNIDGKEYTYEAWQKYEFPNTIESFSTNDKKLKLDYHNYNNLDYLFEDIKEEVKSRNGTCE